MADQELSEAARALLDLCRGKRLLLAAAESCTGGPGGAVPGKPVGLVYLAAASRSGRLIAHERQYGDIGRAQVRRACVIEALAMLGELAASERAKPPSASG